jgi:hypothetical protein
MLKTMNEAFAPVRIVVENGHATVRTHGASSKVNPALADIVKAMKAGELSVPPGVYRIEVTRSRFLRYEYNLRPVQ